MKRIMATLAALAVLATSAAALAADSWGSLESAAPHYVAIAPNVLASPAQIGQNNFVCEISDSALPHWITAATLGAFSDPAQRILVTGKLGDQHQRDLVQVIGQFSGGKDTQLHCYNSEIQVDWKSSLTVSKL